MFDHRRQGSYDHVHAPALLLGLGLDSRQLSHVFYNTIEQFSSKLGMGHLAASKHDKDFYLVAVFKKFANMLGFEFVVVCVNFGPETHLLDFHGMLFLARIFLFLGRFIFEAAIIHNAAHRRFAVSRHLHQVKIGFAGAVKGFFDRNNSYLFSVSANQPDRGDPNSVIDARLSWSRYAESPSSSVNVAVWPHFLLNLCCQALGFNLFQKFFEQIIAAHSSHISIASMAQRDLAGFGLFVANHQHVWNLGQFGLADFVSDFF